VGNVGSLCVIFLVGCAGVDRGILLDIDPFTVENGTLSNGETELSCSDNKAKEFYCFRLDDIKEIKKSLMECKK